MLRSAARRSPSALRSRWMASVRPSAMAELREAELRREADEWGAPALASAIPFASNDEIPVLDLSRLCETAAAEPLREGERARLAEQLRESAEQVGFMCIVGHGVPQRTLERAMSATARFHALPLEAKMEVAMDAPGAVLMGVGYLPARNFKLPARGRPNENAAYIIKRELGPRDIRLEKMPWPCSQAGFDADDFREALLEYCEAMEKLAMMMLPLYARALRVDVAELLAAFASPLFRMRASHYPPTPAGAFGIQPHVDTSFFTLLLTDDPSGLVVHVKKRQAWVRCRSVPGAIIVNTGETLQRLTNDRWPATRHYALNPTAGPAEHARYSLPFFFNPTADYVLSVLPGFTNEANPARYPPQSYLDGQGVVQGE